MPQQYKIAKSFDSDELQSSVQAELNNGWTLGPFRTCYNYNQHRVWLYQVLIKFDGENASDNLDLETTP